MSTLTIIYPRVSDILPLDKIPNELEGLRDALTDLFDDLYVKDLFVSVSADGSSGYYSLSIVSFNQLGLTLPFAGGDDEMKLVINPTVTGTTEIPVTLDYKWEILKYIKQFSLESFDNALHSIVQIFFDLAETTPEAFLKSVIVAFIPEANAIEAMINKINTDYNTAINYDPNQGDDDQLAKIADTLAAYDLDLVKSIVQSYLEGDGFAEGLKRVKQLFENLIDNVEDNLKEAIKLHFTVQILDLSLGLRFPRKWLQPVYNGTDIIVDGNGNPVTLQINDPLPENYHSYLTFDVGSLMYSTDSGLKFYKESSFDLNKSMIGKTGLLVEFEDLKVDLSNDKNIPEAELDGRPANFKGAYAKKVAITLPSKWFKEVDNTTAVLSGYDLLVGTGGISGTIALEAVGGDNTLWASIGSNGGFKVGFREFDISFKQNKVVSSNIKAGLEIKKFVYPDDAEYPDGSPILPGTPVKIDITGHLTDDGDFNLTASAEPPYPIVLPQVFTYNLKSIELGKQDDDFYIGTAGTIEFEGFLKNTLNLGPIEINRLRIYSDGSIEFDGGSISLIKPIVLHLGPVEITVSAIHYGSIQKEVDGITRKFNYFGFDGGISVDPLGVEIRGDGVKFYYCTDDLPNKPHSYLHIQTLYLDLTIPSSTPVAIINGWLSIPEPGVSKEYAGGIKLQLPKAKISGRADMKLAPKYPAFIIDAEIEFPAPIPLGTFAIYGFRGLMGYRYVAEKEAIGLVSGVNTWYEYYKAPPRGIHVQKFNGPDKTKLSGTPVSIGAGASLGTSFDNGTVLNIKAMVLLSIPSLFMIDGRAAIISARLGLDDSGDPPFFAFVALGDNSLEFGFGADFKLPKSSGSIVSLYAEVQAGFFFKDSSKWYVNVGTKQNPVTARILTLITLKSYVMLSAKGIEAGARADFDFKRKYGIIRVHAWAFIEVGGKISFEKPQFGAYLQAEVGADIDIKFISLYFQVGILFAVEAAKPFLIYGKFYYKVRIRILWVFSFSFKGYLEVIWEFDKEVKRDPFNPLNPVITPQNLNSAQSQAMLAELVKGVSMLSAETFPLKYYNAQPTTLDSVIVKHIIPLDTYLDIKTQKGFLPVAVNGKIGGVTNPPAQYTDLVPPDKNVKGKVLRQVKHQYSIQDITIMSWNPDNSQWVAYEPYKALYPDDPNMNATLSKRLGQFQKTDGQYNTVRVLATTPFSFTEQGEPGWHIPEQYGTTNTSIFCEGSYLEQKKANFLNKVLNHRYYCYDINQMFYSNEVAFLLEDRNDSDFAFVTDEPNIFDFTQSLSFNDYNRLELILPDPSVEIILKLTSLSQGVRIKYYATAIDDNAIEVPYCNPDPNAADPDSPFEITATVDELGIPVEYIHPEWKPVTKITIQSLFPDEMQEQIDVLTEQIAAIENQNNMINLGMMTGTIQSPYPLQQQLNLLVCSEGTLKKSVYRYDNEDNIYAIRVGDHHEGWTQSWDFDTDSKIPENDFGFWLDGSLRIESNYQLMKVRLLPIIVRNSKTGEIEYIVEPPPYYVVYNNKKATIHFAGGLSEYIDWTSYFDAEITYFISGKACGEGKPEVCELLDSILNIFENCFTQPLTNQAPYDQQVGCTRNILILLTNFNNNYPNYNLFKILQDDIKILNDFMGKPDFEHYIKAYGAVEHILDYLSELGNCNCTCKDNPKRNTLFHEVSWLSLEDWEYNINVPDQDAIAEDTAATVQGLAEYIQPIWRPDTSYLLKFTLADTVDNGTSHPFSFIYGFTTAGPLGYFHTDNRSAYGDIALKAGDQLLKPDNTYYTAAANQVLEDTTGLVRNANGTYVIDPATNKPLQTVAHPDNYALTSLRRYIDYNRSYPNADGNLLGAKPLFYKDESTQIYLFFTKTYVENFFRTWEEYNGKDLVQGRLKVVIKDPKEGSEIVNPPALDYVEEMFEDVPQTIEDWNNDTSPQVPYSVSQYSNLYNGQNCVLSGGKIIPKSSYIKITPKNLKPSKLYTAIVNNLFDLNGDGEFNYNNDTENPEVLEAREVHKFVFQTSRYENFYEQVNSCFLSGDESGETVSRQAVFRFEKSFTDEEIQAAYNTVVNLPITGLPAQVMENLKNNYQDPYDRIFEGIFGFSPFEDPISTEFNIIRNITTGAVVAMIIRNPEPFNNPKFPADVIRDTIEVLRPSLNPVQEQRPIFPPIEDPRFADLHYKVLYSKDNSQAIIMHENLVLHRDVDVRFKYKLWNGFEYQNPDSVIVRVDVINN